MDWEREDREVVYRGRVVEVHRDTVRLRPESGVHETKFDVVRHPGAAAIVPLFEDGSIVLLHQFRYAVEQWIWEIPAGSLGASEDFRTCAERELIEETGYRAERWTPLLSFYTTPGFCDEELRVFLAEQLSVCEADPEIDEHFEIVRVPFTRAIEWASKEKIRDAKTLLGLSAAREWLESEGRWPPEAGSGRRGRSG